MIIDSLQNPKIKNVIKLHEAKYRKKQGLFLIEGEREIEMALASGINLQALFHCSDLTKNLLALDKRLIFEVSKKVFDKISFRENPDGFLAVAKVSECELKNIKLSSCPLVLIAEAIEKPGNLGAIARTAEAIGLDVIILIDPKIDMYNPNVIRASQGAIFDVKIVRSNSKEVLGWCQQNKIQIVATTAKAEKNYIEIDYKKPTAILVGSEDKGLSKQGLELSDERIKIPMQGKITSLNVSVATAVVLYEAVRQRGTK